MTVRVELADGTTELFETAAYKISRARDFHPAICSVAVYDGNGLVARRKRPFVLFYKKITFRSKKVQDLLRRLNEQNTTQRQAEPETDAENATEAPERQ